MKAFLVLMSFSDCLVQYNDQILFKPEWGTFDMAIGENIVSVFNGPADPDGFGMAYELPKEKTHKIQYSVSQRKLFELYGKVRMIRETKTNQESLAEIWNDLKNEFTEDWLLSIEILEIFNQQQLYPDLAEEIITFLASFKIKNTHLKSLIDRGLHLI
jgi:phenylalanine-4-hydroxylase